MPSGIVRLLQPGERNEENWKISRTDGYLPSNPVLPSGAAELAIAGGADTISFARRLGDETDDPCCRAIQALCKKAGVTFIINDRVDVAIASHAEGVHLGAE